MIVRFIIIAVLLGLRLYGANSNLIKGATAVGMTITAFSILYILIRGRNKRPMGGAFAFWGILISASAVGLFCIYKMKTVGMNFYLLPIIFISIGLFALAVFLMKSRSRFSSFMGGIFAGGAVSAVVVAFVAFFLLGATSGNYGEVSETFNVALGNLPF